MHTHMCACRRVCLENMINAGTLSSVKVGNKKMPLWGSVCSKTLDVLCDCTKTGSFVEPCSKDLGVGLARN